MHHAVYKQNRRAQLWSCISFWVIDLHDEYSSTYHIYEYKKPRNTATESRGANTRTPDYYQKNQTDASTHIHTLWQLVLLLLWQRLNDCEPYVGSWIMDL